MTALILGAVGIVSLALLILAWSTRLLAGPNAFSVTFTDRQLFLSRVTEIMRRFPFGLHPVMLSEDHVMFQKKRRGLLVTDENQVALGKCVSVRLLDPGSAVVSGPVEPIRRLRKEFPST
jgi:hypothetical protein